MNETFYKGKDRSDSQLYKQAGNSIITRVAESLLHNLLKSQGELHIKLDHLKVN